MFTGGVDGDEPIGNLVRDAAGNLYGTTQFGGYDPNGHGGFGVVFKLSPNGHEKVLHTFTGPDGAYPHAGLVRDAAGNVYGTTFGGGASREGVVFEVDANGVETVLHSFSGADGNGPFAGLVRDAAGDLYGTAGYGGAFSSCVGGNGCGVVFKLDAKRRYHVLHNFSGLDGSTPEGDLIRDAAGNLYGTTLGGGAHSTGVAFKLDPSGHEGVVYSFKHADGSPLAGLVRDAVGNLYGTTYTGGDKDGGIAFKLDTSGTETVLQSFNGMNGYVPQGDLIRDAAGDLYGMTYFGGTYRWYGVIFKLDPSGNETVLHVFNPIDGSNPVGGLVRDTAGNFYGATTLGGRPNSGVVFELTR